MEAELPNASPTEPVEAKPRRKGNPNMVKGGPSVNPEGGRRKVDYEELKLLRVRVAEYEDRERAREAAAVELDSGVITSAKMRKVLGQLEVTDAGATERRLREWLQKDVAKYEARARELEAEEGKRAGEAARLEELKLRVAELEGEKKAAKSVSPERDEGSAYVLGMIDKILKESADEATN